MAVEVGETPDQLVVMPDPLAVRVIGQLRAALGPESIEFGGLFEHTVPVPVRSFSLKDCLELSGDIVLRSKHQYWRYFLRVQGQVRGYLDVELDQGVNFVRSQIGPAAESIVSAIGAADDWSRERDINYRMYLFEVPFLELSAVALFGVSIPSVEEVFFPAFGMDLPAFQDSPPSAFRASLDRAVKEFREELAGRRLRI